MKVAQDAVASAPVETIELLMLKAAWLGMLGGVVSGAVIGLFFHREDWMGGYQSYRRRLTRLGHISFFGLGFLNFAFVLTLQATDFGPGPARIAAVGLIVAAVMMPTVCFLSAWRKPFRHLFPIPVGGALAGIAATLAGF